MKTENKINFKPDLYYYITTKISLMSSRSVKLQHRVTQIGFIRCLSVCRFSVPQFESLIIVGTNCISEQSLAELNKKVRALHIRRIKPAVLNSSPRAPPLCIFRMLLLSLQMFVLLERKCPAKWTSQDIPPWFQFEANVYIPFKVRWSVQDVN